MPQYKLTGRDKSGKAKTVKLTAANAEEAAETAGTENKGFVFKDAQLLKGEIIVKGPFIYRTFVVAAANSGYSDDEAKAIFEDRLRAGTIVNSGPIGFPGGVNKFEMK